MANDLNNCFFIGRLGNDPDQRFMPNGKAVTNFSLAVGWKSGDKEGTEWVRVTAYDKLAEVCGEYLRKGAQAFVSGRMTTRKWTDKENIERYTTEIVAERVQFLSKPTEGSQPYVSQSATPRQAPRQAARQAPSSGGASGDEWDDPIPF